MAHDVTVEHNPDATDWNAWRSVCAEGDFTSTWISTHAEALESATWHAQTNGGTVIDPWATPEATKGN